MINIAIYADRIDAFLKEKEDVYKIFVRINFEIDVYLFTEHYRNEETLLKELSRWEDEMHKEALDFSSVRINWRFYKPEDREDSYYEAILSTGKNSIEWGNGYRINTQRVKGGCRENPDLYKAIKEVEEGLKPKKIPPIVSFYSYKGGMGRTTTAVAYAIDLVRNQGKRVVLIDCDLEAPGYMNFFDLSSNKRLQDGRVNGLVEFLSDVQFATRNGRKALDLNNYMLNIGDENQHDELYKSLSGLHIIPGGNLPGKATDMLDHTADYLEGLSKLNLSNAYDLVKNGLLVLLEKIVLTVDPDIVILDSRTGFNDVFGAISLYLSDCVVGFFGLSDQSYPGLKALLHEYRSRENMFDLILVNSILPIDYETVLEKERFEMFAFVREEIDSLDSTKPIPSLYPLTRIPSFELLGLGRRSVDENFITMRGGSVARENGPYSAYLNLFEAINEKIGFMGSEERFEEEGAEVDVDEHARSDKSLDNTSAIVLRNRILQNLKNVLRKHVTSFAEDGDIKEEYFFYREFMSDFFDSEKFLIQGYKGTGKTYLYRALGNKSIVRRLLEAAKEQNKRQNLHIPDECLYVNVLPAKDGLKQGKLAAVSYPFDSLTYDSIKDPRPYFTRFWQVYTWWSVIAHPDMSVVKEASQLKRYIDTPIEVESDVPTLFDELIDSDNRIFREIELDMLRADKYLSLNNKKLFILYDRLDTCINPIRWNVAVSPLVGYWRERTDKYSHIHPKIFVRTDLFRRLEGTNIQRLQHNIISIEWKIEEVFSYFFKLVLSDEEATSCFEAIAKKIRKEEHFNNVMRNIRNDKWKQISTKKPQLAPFVRIFFGEISQKNNHRDAWEYFKQELANADKDSISLRPFINMLIGSDNYSDRTAIDLALAYTENYVRAIIPDNIYASREVRINTANAYFHDLIQDQYSRGLEALRDFLNSDEGESYRFKELTEKQFNELLEKVYKRIDNPGDKGLSNLDGLRDLIFANGVMAEKISRGKFYRYASMYWYAWQLRNGELKK